jgi:hypothetical protein
MIRLPLALACAWCAGDHRHGLLGNANFGRSPGDAGGNHDSWAAGVDHTASDAATVVTTLWGRNLIAIKALRWLAWLRPITTSVAWMTVSY